MKPPPESVAAPFPCTPQDARFMQKGNPLGRSDPGLRLPGTRWACSLAHASRSAAISPPRSGQIDRKIGEMRVI